MSRAAGGAALRSMGLVVERSAGLVLRKVLGRNAVQPGVRLVGEGGKRVLDFWIKAGERMAVLEAKLRLPLRVGDQLTRLVSQIKTAQSATQGTQVVRWTFRAPNAAQMDLLLSQLGPEASTLQLVNGLSGLAQWARFFFLIP